MNTDETKAIEALPLVLNKLINNTSINTSNEARLIGISERTFRDNFSKIIRPILGENLQFEKSDNSWKLKEDHHVSTALISAEELVYLKKLEILSKKYCATFPKIEKVFFKYKEMSSDIIYKQVCCEKLIGVKRSVKLVS